MLLRFVVANFLIFAAGAADITPGFEPNRGQAGARYGYVARAGQARIFIEDTKLTVSVGGERVLFRWIDAAPGGAWTEHEPTGDRTYYCNDSNIRLCRTAIPSYKRLVRGNIYRGIDWVLYGRDSNTEYDLVVHPGSDVNEARLRVSGVETALDKDGRLRAGRVMHWRPQAYQWVDGRKVAVEVSLYQAGEREFGFRVGEHRTDRDLTIDPVIEAMAVVGAEEDDEVVGSQKTSCGYRYGTTRGGRWNTLPDSRSRDVFVQYLAGSGIGATTIFWGGEGDEEIGGSAAADGNCSELIVGWTNSRNAPLTSSYAMGASRPYAGGATDGFLLQFSGDGISYASYFGGPGADRLYDARLLPTTGIVPRVAIVGETDDSSWSGGGVIGSVGSGGKVDAIVGLIEGSQLNLVSVGGAGDDRALRLRTGSTYGSTSYALAGETDSPNFPLAGGATAATGKDVWVAQVSFTPLAVTPLTLFGGTGEDRLGGLSVIAGEGIYVAGTTSSKDLPSATGPYRGGSTDGFVAWLDEKTGAARKTVYLGGTGRDEIRAMEAQFGDLYLGGWTDSGDLDLPGLAAGEAYGGTDGLFVACTGLLELERAVRLGGTADDRVLGVEPLSLGKVQVVGTSQSAEWLEKPEWLTVAAGKTDGFALTLSYAAIRLVDQTGVAVPNVMAMGPDLQMWVNVQVTSEPGMDGLLTVRSSDPARLVVGKSSNSIGTGQILLRDADQPLPYSPGQGFYLQALTDEGEVDVIIEGRATAASAPFYPRKKLRVRLSPTGMFFVPHSEQRVMVNERMDIRLMLAATLPDGSAGRSMALRGDVRLGITLVASDPEAMVIEEGPFGASQDLLGFRVRFTRDGSYTLTLRSERYRSGPTETLPVVAMREQSTVIPDSEFIATKDHYYSFSLREAVAGDRLRVSTDDFSRVGIAAANSEVTDSMTLEFPAMTITGLSVVARSSVGTARVRIEGTYRGRPVLQVVTVWLTGYTAAFQYVAAELGTGVTRVLNIVLTPRRPAAATVQRMYEGTRRPEVFEKARMRSSDPGVLEVTAENVLQLSVSVTGRNPGTARLYFDAGGLEEFANLRAEVRVVPARIDFGRMPVRVPMGATLPLYPSLGPATASLESLQRVRLRVPEGSPLRVGRFGNDLGNDVTADLTTNYPVLLSALAVTVPVKTAVLVSAPGIPEYEVPVRITERVLIPRSSEVEVTAPSTNKQYLSYALGTFDDEQGFAVSFTQTDDGTMRARVNASPVGICDIPETLDARRDGSMLAFTCSQPGVVTVALEPLEGLASAQPRFTAKIISRAPAMAPLFSTMRVFTGNRVQALFTAADQSRSFRGTLTSSDPEKVRLSFDPKAPGTASLQIGDGTSIEVWVQGYSAEGSATIQAEAADGRRGDVKVHLFPATLAVRPKAEPYSLSDLSDVVSVERPLPEKDLAFDVRPSLVEPASGKILWPYRLGIRGGTDPMSVRGESTNTAVVEAGAASAILSETDASARINFKAVAKGEAVLSVAQPPGFVAVADSGLRVRVVEQELMFSGGSVVVSPDLQALTAVYPVGGDSRSTGSVTLTSLEPEKILLSNDQAGAGQTSIRSGIGQPVYVQTLPTAVPGDKVRIRLEGQDYAASEREVTVTRAVLTGFVPVTVQPETITNWTLAFGPADNTGKVSSAFGGGLRPGANLTVRVTSSNPAVIEVPESTIRLAPSVAVPLRGVTPGAARLYVETDPGITNQVGSVAVVVTRYEFNSLYIDNAPGYLVSSFGLTNPTSKAVAVTVTSTGTSAVWLGTADTGGGRPAAGPATVMLPPKVPNVITPTKVYYEPAVSAGLGTIQLTADDFETRNLFVPATPPRIFLTPNGTTNQSLAAGTISLTLGLGAVAGRELPLGSSYGPLAVTVESSNPQVARVGTATVNFASGESRKTVTVQLVGRGQAVISAVAPVRFTGPNPERQALVINVQ